MIKLGGVQRDVADVVLICVPTPLSDSRDPDLTYVINTTKSIAKTLRPGQLIVLESTTYPGTTKDVMLPILEKSGLKAGEDFFLAYSPEREDPGNPDFTAGTIPKVVGGYEKNSTELATLFYEQAITAVVPVDSCEAAEACKILENTYRSVNIAMVNELKVLFQKIGIDIWEVIDAAKTKVWVPSVLSRPWTWRTLHSNRSVLSELGCSQTRNVYKVH